MRPPPAPRRLQEGAMGNRLTRDFGGLTVRERKELAEAMARIGQELARKEAAIRSDAGRAALAQEGGGDGK